MCRKSGERKHGRKAKRWKWKKKERRAREKFQIKGTCLVISSGPRHAQIGPNQRFREPVVFTKFRVMNSPHKEATGPRKIICIWLNRNFSLAVNESHPNFPYQESNLFLFPEMVPVGFALTATAKCPHGRQRSTKAFPYYKCYQFRMFKLCVCVCVLSLLPGQRRFNSLFSHIFLSDFCKLAFMKTKLGHRKLFIRSLLPRPLFRQ